MNKKIIEVRERVYKNDKFAFLMLACFFVLISIVCLIRVSTHDMDKFDSAAELDYAFGFFFIFVSKIIFVNVFNNMAVDRKLKFRDIFYFFMHYVYKGKFERNLEINEFIRIQNFNQNQEKKKYWENDLFSSITKDSLYEWIQNNVSNHKSIVNVISQRVLGGTLLKKEILYWSQIIPIKNLKVDNIRTLLLANKLYNKSELKNLNFITVEEISNAFSLYTEDEIMRIFTSVFNIKDYCEILNFYLVNKEAFAVKKDIDSLSIWVGERAAELTGKTYFFPPSIIEEREEFEYLSNVNKLERAGLIMSNCILSRKEKCLKGQSFCYYYHVDGEAKVVFEISDKGKMIEAKAYKNSECSKEDYLKILNLIKLK